MKTVTSGWLAGHAIRVARKAGPCQYGRRFCRAMIGVGDEYVEGEANDDAGGYGSDRYCMACAMGQNETPIEERAPSPRSGRTEMRPADDLERAVYAAIAENYHRDAKMTRAMLRELRAINETGEPTDPMDWLAAANLWFHARDKVLSALLRRGLIESTPDGFDLTDAGRAAIAKATGAQA